MSFLLANFASSTLVGPLTAIATTLTVPAADASKFPSPSGAQVVAIVLERKNTLQREIVWCTNRTGSVLTITRAQESTTGLTFIAGDTVSVRLTKAVIDAIVAGSVAINWGDIGGTLSGQTDLQAALDAKAGLDSPVFLNNPRAPTQAITDNDTSIASTAFVKASAPAQVKTYGAVGDGVTDDGGFFVTASTAVGAGNSLYVFPGTYVIGTNRTLSCSLVFLPGAKVKISVGATLTLSAPFESAPGQQVFDTSPGGTVVTASTQPPMNPQMWGADPTGVANSGQAMLATATASGSRAMEVLPGTYYISGSMGINAPMDFHAGAVLKTNAGTVITITESFTCADSYRIFDCSTLGGTIVLSTRQPYVTAQMWGAVADGATNAASYFDKASTAAAAATTHVRVLPGTHYINTNIALAAQLDFQQGAILRTGSGITLTLSAIFLSQDAQRVFDTTTSGGTIVVASTQPYVTPQNWGTDTTGDAIQAALQACERVQFLGGTYRVSRALTNPSNTPISLWGAGASVTNVVFHTSVTAGLSITIEQGKQAGILGQQDRAVLRGITFETEQNLSGPLVSVAMSGIESTSACSVEITGCQFTRKARDELTGSFVAGVRLTNVGVGFIEHCTVVGGRGLSVAASPVAPAWSGATTYKVGEVVQTGSVVYASIQAGINKPPATEPTYWRVGHWGSQYGYELIDCVNVRLVNADSNFVQVGKYIRSTSGYISQGVNISHCKDYGVGTGISGSGCQQLSASDGHVFGEEDYGIYLSDCPQAIIFGNNFGVVGDAAVVRAGIYLTNTSQSTIVGNYLGITDTAYTQKAIQLTGSSRNNTVVANTTINFGVGVEMSTANDYANVVVGNNTFRDTGATYATSVAEFTAGSNFIANNVYWTGAALAPADSVKWGTRPISLSTPGSLGLVSANVGTGLVPRSGSSTDFIQYDSAGSAAYGAHSGRLILRSYAVAALPSAATTQGVAWVTDEGDGACSAYSDGTNWRRLRDNVIVTTGVKGDYAGQVVFPATKNPSAGANTLDDYEENDSWTPTVTAAAGSLTTVSATGDYTVIGNRVSWYVKIDVTTNGTGATAIRFTGPPGFTPAANAACNGVETLGAGFALHGFWIAAGPYFQVAKYDNTYPAGSGYRLEIHGNHRI